MDAAARRTVNMTIRFPLGLGLALLVVAGVALVPRLFPGDFVWGNPRPAQPAVAPAEPPAPPAAEPASGRRREAVLTMPRGTFAKTFAVEPFCKGRLVWTYEDDRVSGTIECESEIAGISAELAIESEVAMSSSGVVFGVISAVRLTEFKMNPQLLAGMTENMPLKIGPQLYPLIEPIVNDLLVDMPFSYHCRVRGDRITISNARIGPSGPIAKYAMVVAPQIAGPIQAPALALEGTYTRVVEKEGPAPQKPGTSPLLPTRPR
jgi:hypothetical protein